MVYQAGSVAEHIVVAAEQPDNELESGIHLVGPLDLEKAKLISEEEQRKFDAKIKLARKTLSIVCPPAGRAMDFLEHGPDIIADGILGVYSASSKKEAAGAASKTAFGLAKLLVKSKF